jgi:hypothetical protein
MLFDRQSECEELYLFNAPNHVFEFKTCGFERSPSCSRVRGRKTSKAPPSRTFGRKAGTRTIVPLSITQTIGTTRRKLKKAVSVSIQLHVRENCTFIASLTCGDCMANRK